MLLKAVNFVSFVAACRRQIRHLPQPDVVVFETDPFLLPFVADQLHRRSSCQMVGYLQDIYPDVAIALGKVGNNWMIRRLRKKLFRIYHRCERMIVLSRDMKQLLLNDGIPQENIEIIPNWADTETIFPVEPTENSFTQEHNLESKFVVMYSGNLGLTQRLEEFVEAAQLLHDDDEIQFIFVGRGARRPDLEQQVESLGLKNVIFLDYQPLEELAHSLSAADLHLIPLTRQLSQCLMPSKLYGILAAGRPYLTNAPSDCELHEITKSQDVGLTVEAGSAQKIAESIRSAKADRELLRELGRRGRALALSRFTKAQSTTAFRDLLSKVTNGVPKQTNC